jgi:hypothetical protein
VLSNTTHTPHYTRHTTTRYRASHYLSAQTSPVFGGEDEMRFARNELGHEGVDPHA